jgi:hypothetical protein
MHSSKYIKSLRNFDFSLCFFWKNRLFLRIYYLLTNAFILSEKFKVLFCPAGVHMHCISGRNSLIWFFWSPGVIGRKFSKMDVTCKEALETRILLGFLLGHCAISIGKSLLKFEGTPDEVPSSAERMHNLWNFVNFSFYIQFFKI